MVDILTTSKPFILLLTLALVVSCGDAREGRRSGDTTNLGEKVTTTASNIEGDSKSLAYAVCKSLEAKKIKYKVSHLNEGFIFSTSFRDCSGQVYSVENLATKLILKPSNSQEFLFENTKHSEYFKDVLTHTSNRMSRVCSKILKGENAPAAYNEGNFRFQYSFSISGNNIQVNYIIAQKDINPNSSSYENYIVTSEEKFIINHNNTSDSSMVGLVEQRSQTLTCPGGNTQTFTQKFLHHTGYTD